MAAEETVVINHFYEVPEDKYPSIPLIVVYENPLDFPGKFVGRLWYLDRATPYAIVKDTFEEVVEEISPQMVKLPVSFRDDPIIVATYV